MVIPQSQLIFPNLKTEDTLSPAFKSLNLQLRSFCRSTAIHEAAHCCGREQIIPASPRLSETFPPRSSSGHLMAPFRPHAQAHSLGSPRCKWKRDERWLLSTICRSAPAASGYIRTATPILCRNVTQWSKSLRR